MLQRLLLSQAFQSISRGVGLAAALAFVTLASGCTFFEKCTSISMAVTMPAEPVGRVDTVFQNNIQVVDDTLNPGNQVPGLTGRVWLFAEDGKSTVAARGHLEVQLYDMAQAVQGKPAAKLAEWKFQPRDLKTLVREDQIGMGYTLFLPFLEYRPEIRKVQLRLTYIDERGVRHDADPTALTLRGPAPAPQIHVEERKIVPVAAPSVRK